MSNQPMQSQPQPQQPYPTFYSKYGPEGQAANQTAINAPQAGQMQNEHMAISPWSQMRQPQQEQSPWGF